MTKATPKVPSLLDKMSVTTQKAWYKKHGMPLPAHLTSSVAQAKKAQTPSARTQKMQTASLKAYGATKGTAMGAEDGSGVALRDTVKPLSPEQHNKVAAAKRTIDRQPAAKTKPAASSTPSVSAPKKPLSNAERLAAIARVARKIKSGEKFDVPTEDPDDRGHEDMMDLHHSLHIGRGQYNEEVEQIDEGYQIKKTDSEDEPGEFDSSAKRHHYEIHKNGKKVGHLEYGTYFGNVSGKLHGKRLPEIGNYSGQTVHAKLHGFLKSKTGQKWASNLHKYQKEEVEQIDEGKLRRFSAAISKDEHRTLRIAKAKGDFHHQIGDYREGGTEFHTRDPRGLAKDMERHIDSGETSWGEILGISKGVAEEVEHFNEGKHQATIAAIAAHAYVPKVGDKIRTRHGGQIPGEVTKVTDTHVHFKHPEGKTYKTSISNVMREEVEQIDEWGYTSVHRRTVGNTRRAARGSEFTGKPGTYNKEGIRIGKDGQPMIKTKAYKNSIKTNEEVEQIDEERVNHREFASAGIMHPDMANRPYMKAGNMIDFYSRKNGDKLHGKVLSNDRKTVRIEHEGKVHKFNVRRGLPILAKEEVEQIDELKKSTLASYIKKSAEDLEVSRWTKNWGKLSRRTKGFNRAVNKLAKEEVEQVDEIAKWRTNPKAHDIDTDGSYLSKTHDKIDQLQARNEYLSGAKDYIRKNIKSVKNARKQSQSFAKSSIKMFPQKKEVEQIDEGVYSIKKVSQKTHKFEYELGHPYDDDIKEKKHKIYDAQGNHVGSITHSHETGKFSRKHTNRFETELLDKKGKMKSVPAKYTGSIHSFPAEEQSKVSEIQTPHHYLNKYLVHTNWYKKNIKKQEPSNNVKESCDQDYEVEHKTTDKTNNFHDLDSKKKSSVVKKLMSLRKRS